VPSALRLHLDPGIVRLELTEPDGYPRLTTPLLEELARALDPLLLDHTCQGIVIHGSEKCFATGADIAELSSLAATAALEFARRTQLLFDRLANAAKPTLAAVAGYCLGGGFDLALACHARLATPDALFGHPGSTLGLMTGWGGTQHLPRLIGGARTLELLLLGEPIPAEKALAFGVVSEIVPAQYLLSRAREVLSAAPLPHRRGAP